MQCFFWGILPARDREAMMGDALEAYHETEKRFGRRAANQDYAKETVYAIIAAAWRRFEKIITLWRRGQ